MKKQLTIIASLALACFTQAGVYQVDLSTGGVPGLSPTNEVPAVTNSTGGGGEIMGGITFDSDTALLSLSVGYGSAAGFTDLTGPATAMHLHGPAGAGTNAAVVADLQTNSFPALNPASGGIIFGTVALPPDQVSNLLSGLLYLNIHTATNAGGELRGQLLAIIPPPEPTNSAPEIVCPEPVTAECSSVTTLKVQVSDPDGDALTLVWTVNGTAMQTNQVAASTNTAPVEESFDAIYQLGTNEVSFTVTDSEGATAECSTTVVVEDTTPPEITKLTASKAYLWPPNHKMVPVNFSAVVTDECGTTTWKITSITSNQAEDALGSGNTAPDYKITGDHTANLLAERSGVLGTRVYTITVEGADESGNVSEAKSVRVYVPHDMGSLLEIQKQK